MNCAIPISSITETGKYVKVHGCTGTTLSLNIINLFKHYHVEYFFLPITFTTEFQVKAYGAMFLSGEKDFL